MGTSWLLANNNLAPFCAKFSKSGDLCISNTCKTYVIQANDTCLYIAKSNRLSQVQLYTCKSLLPYSCAEYLPHGSSHIFLCAGNPVLGYLCNKIEKSVGDSICVSPPGDADFKPNPTPTMAPVPGDFANGTNSRCAKLYQVQPDEYCNLLILKFSISLVDFRFLNQGINDNCTNLFAFESYCVESLGPINEYPGHTDYIPPQSSAPEFPYNNLLKATFTAPKITGLLTAAPLAKGTRRDCYLFMNGAELAVSEGILLSFKSACDALVKEWWLTPEQLANWLVLFHPSIF
jgi:hypothetical protein